MQSVRKQQQARRCKRQARSLDSDAVDIDLVEAPAAAHVIAIKSENNYSTRAGMDEAVMNPNTPKRPLYPIFEASEEAADDDAVDDAAHHVEKKRRLSMEQVKSLEKHFELENKLEPDRKLQLARELGLQPRQVAVWFQNRRARWKTKQLEKDYDALKSNFDTLKGDYGNLLQEKDKLEAEVNRLNELLTSKPPEIKPPRLKLEVDHDQKNDLGNKNNIINSQDGFVQQGSKKDCSSSDSDDSEILDDESPRPIESESGFSYIDQLDCHIPEDHPHNPYDDVVYSRIPKLEEPSGFLDLEENDDQGSISWWVEELSFPKLDL